MPVLSPAPTIEPFPGSRLTPLAAPSRGSARPSVWTIEIQPGTPAAPHQVTDEEIFVVLDGEASVTLDGEVTRAVAGDAVVVPPRTDLALGNGGTVPLPLLCVLPVGGQARTPEGAVFPPPWVR